jgi:endonuclease YncB( thermonuclease family)
MRESYHVYTTRRLVACALAIGVVVAGSRFPDVQGAVERTSITGVAKVVDGDTIDVGVVRVRLEGIDAPEVGQTCTRGLAGTWPCGTAATNALAARVEGKQVECERRGVDKYGRVLGVCFVAKQDVNAWMVRHGHAWAFIKYSASYVNEEAQARAERIGIWQGEATPAWEYRQQRWANAEQIAPQGCAIKGNVTSHGKIYHMPWSPWYAQIRMDPGKGERWFCTEAEAVAAGWRPVSLH